MAEWYERLGKGLARTAQDAAIGAGTGGVLGSVVPGIGNVLGGIGGAAAGLGYGLYDAFTGDSRDEAAQQQAAQQQTVEPTALSRIQQLQTDNAQAIHQRANPYAGEAWRAPYMAAANGLADRAVNQEQDAMRQAGHSGNQQGGAALAAIRAGHSSALSQAQLGLQQHYTDQAANWQQNNDQNYGSALAGLYGNAQQQDTASYQRGQDVLNREDRANANYGSALGSTVNAGLSFLGTPTGGRAFDAASNAAGNFFAPAQPQVTDWGGVPTSTGGPSMSIAPQKSHDALGMKLPKRGNNGGF